MKIPRPSAELFRLLAIAACIAGIVHIAVTFAMPGAAGQTAFRRLAGTLPLNTLAILPPVTPSTQPLPYLAADARYAMCRYDTTDAAVSVEVTLPDAGWLLAIYSPQGDNFYYVPGQPGRPTRLSLLLVPPGDQAPSAPIEADTGPRSGAPAIVASRQGVVVVKAPIRGIAYDGTAEQELRRARCQVHAPTRTN